MKKTNPFTKNKYEIMFNVINSGIAAGLVFVGTCLDGTLTARGVMGAIMAGLIVFLTKFGKYWDGQAGEYASKAFSFVGAF